MTSFLILSFPRFCNNKTDTRVSRPSAYVFPNDTPEIERLDLQHELFKLLFNNNLHLAPLATDKPLRVIDIGTGTGQWAIDLGDQYPLFQIQGTDLSPIQPSSVPPNVEFFVDDATEHDWGVDAAHFDYVHMRAMCGSFESYKSIIERSFHYLKPGAWMEIQEFMCTPFCDDDSLPPNWPFYEWSKLLSRAGARVGRSLDDADQLKKWCEEVGFVDVHEQVFHLPVNAWARDARLKEVGRMHEENILEGLGGFSMAHFTRTLGWSKDEIEVCHVLSPIYLLFFL